MLVLAKGFPRDEVGLLNGVAGLALILKKAHGGSEEIIHMRQGFRLEYCYRLPGRGMVFSLRNHRDPLLLFPLVVRSDGAVGKKMQNLYRTGPAGFRLKYKDHELLRRGSVGLVLSALYCLP